MTRLRRITNGAGAVQCAGTATPLRCLLFLSIWAENGFQLGRLGLGCADNRDDGKRRIGHDQQADVKT
jgi:hypothetical protein